VKRYLAFALAVALHGAESLPRAGPFRGGQALIASGRRVQEKAGAFEKALSQREGDAGLYYWAGKSDARLAGVSGPMVASRTAKRVRRNLEKVQLDPSNQASMREMFEFYLDSSEWFGGGIQKAAQLLERIEPEDPESRSALQRRVMEARRDQGSLGWRLDLLVQWPLSRLGRAMR
jgi:hypothetical protein